MSEPGRRGRVRGFVASRSASQRLGALGVVLVLATAPFGGWRSASEQDVARLALGQRLDLGPFYLTIESVSEVAELPPVLEADGASRYLVLRTTVTNHTDRPEFASLVADALGADGTGALPWDGEQVPRLRVFGRDDAVELPSAEYANPDQTLSLAFVLRQRPGVDLDEVVLQVYGYRFQEVDPYTLDPERWIEDDTPLAEGHVPIEVEP